MLGCLGLLRNSSVCFGCFDIGAKHRNKLKFFVFDFTKQTETNPKQILFRFEPKFIFVCFEDTLALTNLSQTSLVLQDLVSSGLPFAKPNYDGADNYLLSQSDDPLMKVNVTSSSEVFFKYGFANCANCNTRKLRPTRKQRWYNLAGNIWTSLIYNKKF
jgi:hypothetical protein